MFSILKLVSDTILERKHLKHCYWSPSQLWGSMRQNLFTVHTNDHTKLDGNTAIL